jgi:hypothetical protein
MRNIDVARPKIHKVTVSALARAPNGAVDGRSMVVVVSVMGIERIRRLIYPKPH